MSKNKPQALTLHHASVIVANCQYSLTFYVDIIGLRASPGRPDLGYPGAWLVLGRNDEQQIHLLEFPEKAAIQKTHIERDERPGHNPHLALTVNDLSVIKSRLENANIKYSLSSSGRPALFCRDYDGNIIEIIETQK